MGRMAEMHAEQQDAAMPDEPGRLAGLAARLFDAPPAAPAPEPAPATPTGPWSADLRDLPPALATRELATDAGFRWNESAHQWLRDRAVIREHERLIRRIDERRLPTVAVRHIEQQLGVRLATLERACRIHRVPLRYQPLI